MADKEEVKAKLNQESVLVSPADTTPEKLIEIAKGMFSKGYGDVELIGKIGSVQICYIDLLEAGDAAGYKELPEDLRLSLLNSDYVVEDGIVCDAATLQTPNAGDLKMLDQWVRSDADYFSLKDEETTAPSLQIQALIAGAEAIAAGTGEQDKLQFILRPTELHDDLLRVLMEARGVKLDRVEQKQN